jgi:polyhydroxyalkanoate synthesis regulator phasin
VLKGSKDPVAAHLGTKGTDRDVVRAVTGKGWTARTPIEGRPALFGARTALNSGKAGLVGTLIGGASKGIDMENAQAPAYISDLATGLKAQYGPTDEQVKKQLDDIIARTQSHGTTPMTSAEVEDYSGRLHRLKAQFELDTVKRLEAQRAAAGKQTGR